MWPTTKLAGRKRLSKIRTQLNLGGIPLFVLGRLQIQLRQFNLVMTDMDKIITASHLNTQPNTTWTQFTLRIAIPILTPTCASLLTKHVHFKTRIKLEKQFFAKV